MPNWIEAIRRCGLTYIRTHLFDDRLEIYESLHKRGDMTLGKYLVVPIGLDLFMDISASGDSFRRFEDEVVAPFYFKLKGDWGWNLYVAFVLEAPDYARIPGERLSRVERGKRYGKKTVICADELPEKLPLAKIPGRLGGSAAADPLHDWRQTLAPEGLLFCLNNFSKQPLQSFVENGAAPEPELPAPAAGTGERLPARPIGPIAALHFGDRFRRHFLAGAPALEFAQVNLLAGPNGMGKTSVLECIELAFTGAIQRNLLVDRTLSEEWNGRIVFAGDGESFDGIPEEPEKKQRETVYYKHKVAPRGQSQLNRAFHQYNYFSSEAVYQFCFGGGDEIDYRAAFARVIYGEQLERFEQCWTQHLEEFSKWRKRLSDERDECLEALYEAEREGSQQTGLMLDRARADLRQIARWMSRCRIAYPTPDESDGLEQIEQWLHQVKPLLHEWDVISKPFALLQPQDPQNGAQLKEQEAANRNAITEMRKQIGQLQERLEALPPASGLEEALSQDQAEFDRRRSELDRLERIVKQLDNAGALFDQRDSRQRRTQVARQLVQAEAAIRSLTDIVNLYGHLADAPLPDIGTSELQERIQALAAQRLEAGRLSEQTAQRIGEQRERAGKLQRIVAELKSYGRRYTHLHPHDSRCPLCGHDHETAQYLAKAIDSSLEADENALGELMAEADSLGTELQSLDGELAQLREQLRTAEGLAEARTYLRGREDVAEASSLGDNSGPDAVQAVLAEVRRQLDSLKLQLHELQQEAAAWDRRGFTPEAMRQLDSLLREPVVAACMERPGTAISHANLMERLRERLAGLSDTVETARFRLAVSQEKLSQANQARSDIVQQIAGLTAKEQQLVLQAGRLHELRQAWQRLSEHNVRLQEQQAWSEWRQYLQKLMLAAEQLGEALKPRLLTEQQAREAERLAARLDQLAGMLARCSRAVDVLSGLRSLAEYGDDFVRSNFAAISSLFAQLHAPNEFERLEWSAEGKIVAVRKAGREPCAIHRMSTGQRTSVILAIFFIMHLVMESAPQLLLLDEPVANMDELNVLGLLDFLRQLTVTRGTQLFFTTANPQIATLFRRKFSFLGQSFRAFNLRRDADGPIRVSVQQFAPHQEKPVPLSTA
ncbi:hypothetical protein SD70_01970 [Gordoniibacillus kamchatkensis]|uniref:Nuclease SbcCD subunit C n=1 Tax=Gordoniibacillus kamchatkensis TaxID=1590651 RepID=A0ABR5AMX5_9BACL|nr:AAA family ATPase [Paenibacillus sp. VKM B-2647]KIL42306.1 hypothetical protein SD70_01970 [Paenibacillus sp. VKM B-2647]